MFKIIFSQLQSILVVIIASCLRVNSRHWCENAVLEIETICPLDELTINAQSLRRNRSIMNVFYRATRMHSAVYAVVRCLSV